MSSQKGMYGVRFTLFCLIIARGMDNLRKPSEMTLLFLRLGIAGIEVMKLP